MGKTSIRRQFVAGIERVKAHLSAGDQHAAQRILADLRGLIRDDDPNAAARFRAVLDVHDQRVADMNENPQAAKRYTHATTPDAAPNAKSLPDNATCARCRSPFHRDNERTKICSVCRPQEERRSVRTVSGGLPGFGRRR